MTLAEWFSLAQTIVLFLTAVIILVYTVETHKIRKETSVQNSLLAEQLLELQKAREFDINKEVSFVQPLLKKKHQSTSRGECRLIFINVGGAARNLSVIIQNPYTASISPRHLIGAHEECEIVLGNVPWPLEKDTSFILHYTDKLGTKRQKTYELTGMDGEWQEKE